MGVELVHEGFHTIIYKNGKNYVCSMGGPNTLTTNNNH